MWCCQSEAWRNSGTGLAVLYHAASSASVHSRARHTASYLYVFQMAPTNIILLYVCLQWEANINISR